MRTHCCSDSIYLGRKAGARLLSDIRNAKHSVKIVSPYLSPGYVEELVALSRRGIEVTLITSDTIPEGDGSRSTLRHRDLISQERITDTEAQRKRAQGLRYAKLSFLLPIACFLLPLEPALSWTLALLSLLASSAAYLGYHGIRIYSYRYHPLFNLRVFHSPYNSTVRGEYLVHSKVYVIDNRIAYVGSVNFTGISLWQNYECISRIEETGGVRRISEEVDDLFDSRQLYSRPIGEWGRQLYTEPPH